MPDHPADRVDHVDHRVDQSALLTIGEAAVLLRAPVATLRYWRHLGTGPHSFRLGRRVLYRRADLDAWVDARRSAPLPTTELRDRGSQRRRPAAG